jgi:excisionase family DNA binding protein
MKKNPVKAALPPEDEIMEVHTLAEFLRCDKSTIYRLLKNKKIPAFKVGSDWRFMKADIIWWIQNSAVRPKF